MRKAYIIYPDIFLNALRKEDNDEANYPKEFLGNLLKEKTRVSTLESKRYMGFMPDYHWKAFLELILDFLNIADEEEVVSVKLCFESLDRDGIEDYPYMETITPVLDLARDKEDSFDVVIVCDNEEITNKIRTCMNQPHFNKYEILTSKQAFLGM